jgi:ER lumen protein retaining receptor
MILLSKLTLKQRCEGISCRMQEIYAIVFISRYLDLFWSFISIYNTVMKIIFISGTIYCIYLMRFHPAIKQTYERDKDHFAYEKWLLGPCFVAGLLTSENTCTLPFSLSSASCADWTIAEVLWSMSIWLESVSAIPQLVLLKKTQEVQNLTADFVGTMGAYRAFYILNWIYRYFVDDYVNWVGWIGGFIQTAIYSDFLYYYFMSKYKGQRLLLPE